MITCIVMMLVGVAFFSYIMGNFIDMFSSYNATFGAPNKSDELAMWLVSLQRFKR